MTIYSVRKNGYVGNEYYELGLPGAVVTISDSYNMKVIDELLKEVDSIRRHGGVVKTENYVEWHLNEFGWVLPSERYVEEEYAWAGNGYVKVKETKYAK